MYDRWVGVGSCRAGIEFERRNKERHKREFTSRILYLKNYLSTECLRCQYTCAKVFISWFTIDDYIRRYFMHYAQVFISRFAIDDNIGTLLFGF